MAYTRGAEEVRGAEYDRGGEYVRGAEEARGAAACDGDPPPLPWPRECCPASARVGTRLSATTTAVRPKILGFMLTDSERWQSPLYTGLGVAGATGDRGQMPRLNRFGEGSADPSDARSTCRP